jgi:tetratricopeptide (TPR) repeat protein
MAAGRAAWVAALLALAVMPALAAPIDGGPAADAEWERVEAVRQDRGPDAALPLAREALASHPASLPLTGQYTELLLALGGPARVRADMDSLTNAGLEVDSSAVAFAVALETGNASAAASQLARIPRPPPESLDGLLFTLAEARLVLAGGGDPGRADGLIRALSEHPRFEGPLFELWRDELRVGMLRRSDPAAARRAMTRLVHRAEKNGWSEEAARLTFRLGRAEMSAGLVADAEGRFRRSHDAAERLGDNRLTALSGAWRGYALERLGRYRESREARHRATSELRAEDDPGALAYCLLGLGWVAWKTGDPEPAKDAERGAVTLFAQLGDPWGRAQALLNLGIVLTNTDRPREARAALDSALAYSRMAGDPNQELSVRNNLGVLFWSMDRPDLAVPVYEDLLSAYRKGGDAAGVRRTLNNLGLANEQMGRDDQARVLYTRCIDRAREDGGDDLSARLNLARLLIQEDRFPEAEANARRALELAAGGEDPAPVAEADEVLGRALFYLGQEEEALAHLRAADRGYLETSRHRQRLPALVRIAIVLRTQGRTDEALVVLNEARDIAKSLHEYEYAAYVEGERGAVFLAAADTTRAREALRAAEAEWNRVQDLGFTFAHPIRGNSRSAIVARMVETCRGDPGDSSVVAEAFEMLERFKTRAILDAPPRGVARARPQVPDTLVSRETAARSQVTRLVETLGRAEGGAADSLRAMLAEAEASYQAARRAILAAGARYRRAATALPVTLPLARRELLGHGELVLDYLVGYEPGDPDPRPIFLFALDATGLTVHRLDTFRPLLDRTELVVDLMNTPPAEGADGSMVFTTAQGLSRALLQPVADRLRACSRVIVVPHGFLHRLPSAALPWPGGDGTFLVEHVPVTTTPSLHALIRSGEGPSAGRAYATDLTVWSAPRPPAGAPSPAPEKTEAADLLHSFARTKLVTADAEDPHPAETLARSGLLRNSRVLHFIAHGYFDDRQPWRSGLYLTGAGEEGKLETADLYYLRVDCDLVTLSACETARGRLSAAEGWRGFVQGLREAGARSVLATLWSIDDTATARFMVEFYGSLARGRSRAEALRDAQLSFLGDKRLRHPYYWAPFVLSGEVDQGIPLKRRPRLPLWTVTAAAAVALLVLAGWLWRRVT